MPERAGLVRELEFQGAATALAATSGEGIPTRANGALAGTLPKGLLTDHREPGAGPFRHRRGKRGRLLKDTFRLKLDGDGVVIGGVNLDVISDHPALGHDRVEIARRLVPSGFLNSLCGEP